MIDKKVVHEIAKPFLKWAGGKTQLLEEIQKILPSDFNEKDTFIEPFVGSGAVLFWVLAKYPNIKKAVINDVNSDLIICYNVIKNNVEELIAQLKKLEIEFYQYKEDRDERFVYFKKNRFLFNQRTSSNIEQAALFIFLNRTCFNGLFRVNSKNEFNVPMGSYKTPLICNEENLYWVSKALKKVKILNGDFEKTLNEIEGKSFFYFDPPYKPLSKTSSFNSYAKDVFNDNEQIRLRDFCTKLDSMGHSWILSNSDVKESIEDGDFFDKLYDGFLIKRVLARRNINSKSNGRGKLNELLIKNY